MATSVQSIQCGLIDELDKRGKNFDDEAEKGQFNVNYLKKRKYTASRVPGYVVDAVHAVYSAIESAEPLEWLNSDTDSLCKFKDLLYIYGNQEPEYPELERQQRTRGVKRAAKNGTDVRQANAQPATTGAAAPKRSRAGNRARPVRCAERPGTSQQVLEEAQNGGNEEMPYRNEMNAAYLQAVQRSLLKLLHQRRKVENEAEKAAVKRQLLRNLGFQATEVPPPEVSEAVADIYERLQSGEPTRWMATDGKTAEQFNELVAIYENDENTPPRARETIRRTNIKREAEIVTIEGHHLTVGKYLRLQEEYKWLLENLEQEMEHLDEADLQRVPKVPSLTVIAERAKNVRFASPADE